MFLESILFLKTENFKNHFCPVLATQSQVSQVAYHSRELAGHFWRLVHEWKVQSRGVHRDFRGSVRGSLASKTSSCEKHLAKFFIFLIWSVLVGKLGDSLATYLSRENRVFCKMRVLQNELIFNIFLKKGFSFACLALCVCSLSSLTFTYSTSLW